jgi:hypothetical protein
MRKQTIYQLFSSLMQDHGLVHGGATLQQIINTIGKCSSGALSYSIDGVQYKDQNERNPMVTVSKDGSLIIIVDIDLIGNNICNLKMEHEKNIIFFVVVVYPTASHFAK